MTARVRVLALGSPHGDDRAGWLAAEHLADDPSLDVRICADPAVDLLPALDGARQVVLLDALADGGTPGRVLAGVRADLAEAGPRCSTHAVDLPTLLAMAEALDALPPSLSWVGVTIDPAASATPASDDLSMPVRDALPALCAAVRAAARGAAPPFLP